jgi:hypothetical protein
MSISLGCRFHANDNGDHALPDLWLLLASSASRSFALQRAEHRAHHHGAVDLDAAGDDRAALIELDAIDQLADVVAAALRYGTGRVTQRTRDVADQPLGGGLVERLDATFT